MCHSSLPTLNIAKAVSHDSGNVNTQKQHEQEHDNDTRHIHAVVQMRSSIGKGKYLEWGWGPCRVGEQPISKSWLEVREACRGRSLACALSPSLGVLCLLAMSQPCSTSLANQNAVIMQFCCTPE